MKWPIAFLTLTVSALAGLAPQKLTEMDAAVRLAIADGRLPGGVLWVENGGEVHHAAFGNRQSEPPEPTTKDTIYDAASLTKVLATTPAIMRLAELGKVNIESPVNAYLPEFPHAAITVRHLLTHTSGARSGIGGDGWNDAAGAVAKAAATPLDGTPGAQFRYSDIAFILLGEIAARVAGKPLDEFCRAEIFQPLKMNDTMFRPPADLAARIAPTTDGTPRGTVHDPTARKMGGVAGHAGLFTTAADVARFARMMLVGGELDGVRIFKPETIRQMTSPASPPELAGRRGLGWDIDTAYSGPRGRWLPNGSYGHTGWTGGSLWIDPFSKTTVVFLSNRNHPTEAGNVLTLRHTLGTLAAEAVTGFNFLHVEGALPPGGTIIASGPPAPPARPVLTGVDVLARDGFAPLRGLRVGLITNHTGIDRQRRRTADLLAKADGVKLVALFSPEHGIAGKLDEKTGDTRDEITGLPVFSLYGESRAPTAAQLAGLDVLVFDIQDIGCRFYTYISTMGECLAVAAREKKKFIVLDRPNPIGGAILEGPVLDGERSFTGWHDIPLRHGMTTGELARMFNDERTLGADLAVIPCENWSRGQWFDETALPWVNPSPNMRSMHAAALYPGIGLLEFCNISVGRGTDRPFEIIGAPYVDDRRLHAELPQIPGIRFTPVRFTPTASVFAGKECGGVQITLTDRAALNAVDVGLELARAFERLYSKEWGGAKLQKLLVHPATSGAIREGRPLSAIKQAWLPAREDFARRRARWLIYGQN